MNITYINMHNYCSGFTFLYLAILLTPVINGLHENTSNKADLDLYETQIEVFPQLIFKKEFVHRI